MNWKVFYTRGEYELQERKLRKALLVLETIINQINDPAIAAMFKRAIKEINELR
jgi:hypothetical protein